MACMKKKIVTKMHREKGKKEMFKQPIIN